MCEGGDKVGRMIDDLPELEFVSWEKMQEMCFGLAGVIEKEEPDLEIIVAVSRGGLVAARVLSDYLKLPVFNFSIQSYKGLEQEELVINQRLKMWLLKKRVLLVDEIVDSGRSLELALAYLKKLRISSIKSVALHVKPRAVIKPDYFETETPKWVVYPYEVRETVEALWPIWQKAGKVKQDLEKVLVNGGLAREQVRKFL